MTRNDFLNKISKAREKGKLRIVCTATQLPTGAIEIISNTEYLDEKISYLLNAYDDELKLKTNSKIKMLDCIIL